MSSNSAVRSAVLTAFGTGRVGRGRVRNAEKESGARPLGIGSGLVGRHMRARGRGRRTFDDRARDVQLVGHLDTRAGQGQQAALHDPRRELLSEVAHRGVRARQLGHRRPRGPSRRRVIGRIRRAFRRARSVCAERSRRRYRANDDPPGELDVHLPKACASVARVAIGAGAVGRTAFSRLFPFFGDCASYETRRSLRRLKRLKRRSAAAAVTR